jgi:hypothetical protein
VTCVTADLHKCAESYPAAATRAGPGTHRMERCGVEHWGARSGAQCPMPVNVPTYVRACTACFPGCLQQARGVAAEPSSSAASSSPASSKGGGARLRRKGDDVVQESQVLVRPGALSEFLDVAETWSIQLGQTRLAPVEKGGLPAPLRGLGPPHSARCVLQQCGML